MGTLQLLNPLGAWVPNAIGPLEIDLFTEYSVSHGTTVTDAPVETGEAVTDHAFNMPLELSGRGIVSNISYKSAPLSIATPAFASRKLYAFETLNNLWRRRQPMDVVLGLSTYESMVITGLDFAENAKTDEHLEFSITMKQVTIVNTLATDASGRTNEGRRQGTLAQNSAAAVIGRLIERIR